MSDSITPASTGTFSIHTSTGTELLLELGVDGSHITRKPGMNRPDSDFKPTRRPGDFTRLRLAEAPLVALGAPAHYIVTVDGVAENRETAPVSAIMGPL